MSRKFILSTHFMWSTQGLNGFEFDVLVIRAATRLSTSPTEDSPKRCSDKLLGTYDYKKFVGRLTF